MQGVLDPADAAGHDRPDRDGPTAGAVRQDRRQADPGLLDGGTDVRAGRDVLGEAGIATFDSPEAAIKAFLQHGAISPQSGAAVRTARGVARRTGSQTRNERGRCSQDVRKCGPNTADRIRGQGSAGRLRHSDGADHERAHAPTKRWQRRSRSAIRWC